MIQERIAVRMKLMRMLSGMSQDDLSKKSGVSRATIIAIENCESDAYISTIEKLEKALCVRVGSLTGYIDTLDTDFSDAEGLKSPIRSVNKKSLRGLSECVPSLDDQVSVIMYTIK